MATSNPQWLAIPQYNVTNTLSADVKAAAAMSPTVDTAAHGAVDPPPGPTNRFTLPCSSSGTLVSLESTIPTKSESARPDTETRREAATLPRFDLPALQLERRGTTSHKQSEFWRSQTSHKNSIAAKLRSIGRLEEANDLELCHTSFTVGQCKGCLKTQSFPNRCDRFYCPECQPRLANERRKSVKWWTLEIHQPKHIVLTLKNVPDLTRGHVDQLKTWFSRLRRLKFAANWQGGFYSIEVTNEGNGWHLHLHALIDARWVDSKALSLYWSKVTGGVGRIVKVLDARRHDYLGEVTKYCVKGVQLAAWSPQQIGTFIDSFRGVRTFGVFGSLYGKRTEFAEWLKTICETGQKCQCGCSQFWYFSEFEWATKELREGMQGKPRGPDLAKILQLDLPTVPG